MQYADGCAQSREGLQREGGAHVAIHNYTYSRLHFYRPLLWLLINLAVFDYFGKYLFLEILK